MDYLDDLSWGDCEVMDDRLRWHSGFFGAGVLRLELCGASLYATSESPRFCGGFDDA